MGMNKTRWARLSWVTLSLSFLAGCATDYRRNGDPLTGAPPLPVAPAPAALGKPAPPPPPPVGSTAAGSTAALASGVRPGGVNSGLRIGEAPVPSSVPPRQPGATLTGATMPVTGGRAISYEQAQALLTSRGVKWQWLEQKPDTGEWRFMCRLPSRANPNLHRTYEAKGPTHLAAVQAVLDQMDREGAGN